MLPTAVDLGKFEMSAVSKSSASVFDSAPDACITAGRGRLEVWMPTLGKLVTRAEGYMVQAQAVRLVACLDEVSRLGKIVHGYHDWDRITGFEVACPRDLTLWHVRHAHRVGEIHIFAESILVRMAVRTANIALGGVAVLHNDNASFCDALKDAPTNPLRQ